MKMKESLRDYFVFTRKERTGILIVLALVVAVFFLPKAQHLIKSPPKPAADTAWVNTVTRLQEKQADAGKNRSENTGGNYFYDDQTNASANEKPHAELFYFDPNTLPIEDWKKLGIRDRTIHTIQNYLSKGGHFRKPDDLRKIYGLSPDEFERLEPYISIKGDEKSYTPQQYYTREPATPPMPKPRYNSIEINTADTSAFIALPGIGSKLASRIISFREKLGGFYSIEQVKETYGLPDSTFQHIRQYLKVENSSVRKININTATLEELKAHPYIRWQLANPIIAYRKEHGAFTSPADLKKIMLVTDDIFKKISPYITL